MDELEIQGLLDTLKDSFAEIMKKYDLDKSDLVRKSRFLYSDNSIIILMADYSEFVDKGRKSGRMPPISSIVKWIRRSAINVPNGLTVEDFAWAVSKSIARDGVKPRPFLERLNTEVRELTLKYLYAKVNNKLIQTLKTK